MEQYDEVPHRPPRKQNELEVWSAGGDDAYVYTNNWNIVQALRRRFGTGAQYVKNGYVLAWQFKIPRRIAEIVRGFFRQLRKSPPHDVGRISDELSREVARAH